MDRSIRAKFRGDRHVLGPFLGNLPPEILDTVVPVSYTHLTLPTICSV